MKILLNTPVDNLECTADCDCVVVDMTLSLPGQIRTRVQAKRNIYFYIGAFYNSKRRHATLGYLSPNNFEDQPLAPAA